MALALSGEAEHADSLFAVSRAQWDSVQQARGLDWLERDNLSVLEERLARYGLDQEAARFAELNRRIAANPP
jgi:hypothetical protein